MDEGPGRVDHHHGFYAATRFLWETPQLTFLQEHELGEGPPRLDMLIVGPGGEAVLTPALGHPTRARRGAEGRRAQRRPPSHGQRDVV